MPSESVEKTAKKYRKRPVVVEAEQWFPGTEVEGVVAGDGLPNYAAEQVCIAVGFDKLFSLNQYGWIETLEGGHIVQSGDWIITGIKGEKYPCKPDIFEMTYEPAGEG